MGNALVLTRFLVGLAGAFAAAWLFVAPAWAGEPCNAPGYSYAGMIAAKGVYGISGTLTAVEAPLVQSGHVAAWVGIGRRYEGPGGTDEWLQVGLNSLPGTGNRIYYEFVRPGSPITYVEVAGNVATGRPVSVAVLEMAGRPDTWRVWVGGRPVGDPILLPGSHGRLTPVATAENWDGGTPACNTYTYRFDGLRLALVAGGVWRPFTRGQLWRDTGYRVVQSTASFTVSVGPDPSPAFAGASVGATAAPGHRTEAGDP